MAKKLLKYMLVGAVVGGSVGVAVRYLYLRIRGKMEESDEGFEEILPLEDPVEKRVLVLGLEGVGKSRLLSCLAGQGQSGGEVEEVKPTEGFNVMCIQPQTGSADLRLNVWEIGGSVRSYWDNFLQDTDLLVFVVDSADPDGLAESKKELHRLLEDPRLQGVPVIVVANKQDLPQAQRSAGVRAGLELSMLESSGSHIRVVETMAPPSGPLSGIKTLESLLSKLRKSA